MPVWVAGKCGFAWLGMTTALAIHVADEALTDFLPLYNSLVRELRQSFPFAPLPTFSGPVWLGGLVLAVAVLFLMSPLVFAGRAPLRYLSYAFSILMIFNGLGHIGASLYWRTYAPGVFSSPLLLVAAAALLVTTIRAGRETGTTLRSDAEDPREESA